MIIFSDGVQVTIVPVREWQPYHDFLIVPDKTQASEDFSALLDLSLVCIL